MTYKKLKVVMLPTNEKSKLGFIGDSALFNIDDSKPYKEIDGVPKINFQHLYILSDEKIKKQEWMLHPLDGKPIQWDGEGNNPITYGYKKIICTTDKSLTINSIYGINSFDAKMFGGNSEVIKLPQIFNLLQPCQSFIEHFVSEYNKGNIITEVMVEYENKIALDGHTIIGNELKINPDNTINITPVKDSWKKDDEDLIKAFEKFACAVYDANFNKDTSIRQRAEIMSKKWIEENL